MAAPSNKSALAQAELHDSKKRAILEAGMKVLGERGITNTSMNDIIRESGLSKGGVYHYFKSKNELLIELFKTFIEIYAFSNINRLQNSTELQSKPAIEQIHLLMEYYEGTLDEMGKDMFLMMDLFMEAIHNEELRAVFNQQYTLIQSILEELIKTAQKQGDISSQHSSSLLSASLLAVFDGFSMAHQILDKAEDYPRLALSAARLLLKGAQQ